MDPPGPTCHVQRTVDLRYLFSFPSPLIVLSGIDHLSESTDTSLLLKRGIDNYGWLAVNLEQINDGREIDYCLRAMEQSLGALAVDEKALAVDEEELETLEFFVERFSADRSIGDEDSFRAVVTAVRGFVRAARSPRVEDDEAVGDLARVVKGAFGVARAVTSALFVFVRAARSPRDAVAELARAGRSPRVEGDDTLVGLVRTALGEVRAARERPLVLHGDQLQLQMASADAISELLRATPPRTHGVWSTVQVLNVNGLPLLSTAGDVYYELERCCRAGWRVPQMKKAGQARRLDAHLIYLNHKVKLLFGPVLVREDGSVDESILKTIGEQGKALVMLCTEEIHMFQSEVATLPDVLCVMVTATTVSKVREMANRVMVIIRHIRAQRVMF